MGFAIITMFIVLIYMFVVFLVFYLVSTFFYTFISACRGLNLIKESIKKGNNY